VFLYLCIFISFLISIFGGGKIDTLDGFSVGVVGLGGVGLGVVGLGVVSLGGVGLGGVVLDGFSVGGGVVGGDVGGVVGGDVGGVVGGDVGGVVGGDVGGVVGGDVLVLIKFNNSVNGNILVDSPLSSILFFNIKTFSILIENCIG
jgi:hypothetical protein